ncbi:MAG: Fic family protein [Coriobacteriaceae bacterium]|nr:Fic family protein [Coriobacteriaceae bacterium]MCI6845464.1 Fic family protein [Coriobacteriaceae bacterium]MDD7585291.1 Fic family protein [Coriobacteriaceae bacterium]
MSIEDAYARLCDRWGSLEPRRQRELAEAMAVEVTYNSTRIENDEITLHDTETIMRDSELVNYTGDLRAVFEASNHQRAWAAVVEDAFGGDPPEPSGNLVLGLQRVLTEHAYDRQGWERGERPGTIKVHDYGVGPDAGAGLPPGECEAELEGVLAEVRPAMARPLGPQGALVCATYLHARIVGIHPFADGNGRTARLMQNYVLLALGNPPIAQRAEDRIAYYGALDEFHAEGSLDGLLSFNRVESLRTWERLQGTPAVGDGEAER